MPITPLPDDTIRLLGSAVVITTPVALVKELLENSIDAGATSIDILISQNTVDRIEVRDNGNGIHPDDYKFLGLPGHTSKLTSFEELRTIRATTLGFRGQALASANSMGNVAVTTRTLQDPTAVKLELRHGVGGVEGQEHTSAPVGTSVSVTALFSRLPVRKQVVLKETQKSFVNIKHLLHAYALAKSEIRLSFKVVGGNPKQSWSYSPRPQSTVKEAVVQVFGTGVMSQCMIQTLATEAGIETDVSQDGPELVMEAVLPKPHADLSKLSKGPFLSIDSRPITTQRGTGRHLIKIFKTHTAKAWGEAGVLRASNNIFFRVDIKCSPGIYDPNIEPSKDQVVFANESQVTDLFERLCTGIYKAQETQSAFATIEKRPLIRRTQTRTPPPSIDGPEVDETPRSDPAVDHEVTVSDGDIQPSQSLMSSYPSPLHPPMLKTDTNLTQQPNGAKRPRDSPFPRHAFQSQLRAGMLSSPIRQERLRTGPPHLDHASVGDIIVQDISKKRSQTESKDSGNEQVGPVMDVVPQHGVREGMPCQPVTVSKQSRKRGFVVDMSADPDMSSDEETEMLTSRFRGLQGKSSQLEAPSEDSNEGLNPWVIAKMTAPTQQPIANDGISPDISQGFSHRQKLATFGVGETSEEELPILRPLNRGRPPGDLNPPRTTHSDILSLGMDRREGKGVCGFIPAANVETSQELPSPLGFELPLPAVQLAKSSGRHTLPDHRGQRNELDENGDPDGFVQSKLSFGSQRTKKNRHRTQPQMNINDVPTRPNPQFRKPRRLNGGNHAGQDNRTSDFSDNTANGKQIRNKHARSLIGDDALTETSQLPRLDPLRSLEGHLTSHPNAPNPDTGNTEDIRINEDPRMYLARRQRPEAENRGQVRQTVKRTMTDSLPLETIPQGHEIQHLVLVVKPDTKELQRNYKGITEDEVLMNGALCTDIDLKDVTEIEERLKQILSAWVEDTLGERAEVDISLRRVVKGKDVAT